MGLLSLLKSKVSSPASASGGDDVDRARTRARRRLIGAVVLVGAGVIGFPLLFETHPRPIPVDIPIEIANKDKAAPLPMPPARAASARAGAADNPEVITESSADAGRELPAPPVETAPEAPVRPPVGTAREPQKPAERVAEKAPEKAPEKPAARPADKVAEKPAEKPADKPAAVAAAKPASAAAQKPADAARARALLDGKDGATTVAKAEPAKTDEPAASGGRFVVQVGAFAEAGAARETRQKVEKLGLKTYTQVVDTSSGSRIRVRVGPFASREEADRAAGKLKSAGLAAALLTL